MIFNYRTKINERSPVVSSGGSFMTYEIDWKSTKSCCEAMERSLREDNVHFDLFEAALCLADFRSVNFCPACGERIALKEIAKIRRYCTIEKKLVECDVENWKEEIVE